MHTNIRRIPALAVAAFALLVALTACNGLDPASSDDDTGRSGDGGSSDGSGGGGTSHLTVGSSFWHAGFKVTLGDAQVVAGPADYPAERRVLTIDATIQNLGTEDDDFSSHVAVSSAGRHYLDASQLQNLPTIPGKATGKGMIAVRVDDEFRLEDAVLTVGRAENRQAVVTLAKPETVVSLEPRAFELKGKATDGPKYYAAIHSVEARADNPHIHTEARAGHEFVRLNFSLTNDSPAGMAILYAFDIRLVLPDGTSTELAGSCGAAQLYPGPFGTEHGGVACFEVPAPIAGSYNFVIRDKVAEGFRFTLT